MKRTGIVRATALAAALAVAAAFAPSPVSPVAAACTLCAGGEYHPVTPARIFDTRSADLNGGAGPVNDVAPAGVKSIGPTSPSFDIDLFGLTTSGFQHPWLPDGTAAGDVLAVVAGITVQAPTSDGYVSVHPPGAPPAVTSAVVNYRTGRTVSGLAILRPGADGLLTVHLFGVAAGTAHVYVDVFGWLSTSTYDAGTPGDETDERGARLIPVEPVRILDTRNDADPDTPLGAAETRALTVRGATKVGDPSTVAVPDDPNVVGVLANLTVVNPTGLSAGQYGAVSVLPEAPVGAPATANAVTAAGPFVKGTLVMVPVGADGKVHLYNSIGSTNVVVDVMGYLLDGQSEATRNGRVVPLAAPFRVFDTRQVAFGAVALGQAQSEDWSFAAFSSSVKIGGVAVGNQMGLLGNLTQATLSRVAPAVSVSPGYLTMFPAPASAGPPPLIANLNTMEGMPVGNLALVKYGASQVVRVYNARGYAHYVLDVNAVVLAD